MTFRSGDGFRDFARSVRRDLRYVRTPDQDEFLKSVIATSDARTVTVNEGRILWRAQLGHDWRPEPLRDGRSFEVHAAHPAERMKPISEKASDGRANPRGIACLYLATHKQTAVLEVRPLIGSYVSVAQFKVLRDVRVVNCSGKLIGLGRYLERKLTPEEVEKTVWTDINRAFSAPVERGDDSLDYVPTQILAEAFKLHGFDGIAYKSSYGEEGFNIALFDINAADLINCGLYRIRDVSVVMKQEDDPYFVSQGE